MKILFYGLALSVIALSPANVGKAAEATYEPQISNEQGVKVTVIPKNITVAATTWDFEVTLESHTKILNDDLAKSSVLIAKGKRYLPLGWEGALPGGHHRKGVLRFRAISPRPPSMELQIRLEGDPSPRSFKWLLK